MDPLQYYPTPEALARAAWSMFEDKHFVRVLEPSAGSGHLLRPQLQERYRAQPFDAIELDPMKHPALREMGVRVVGLDFLKFSAGSQYSHIIMNPPFAEGAAHVLHAWDILFDGEIVAILNAETLRNPFSAERKRLCRILAEHGRVAYAGTPFEDAERKTDVEVALVWLRKRADLASFSTDWLQDLKTDTAKPEFATQVPQELALPNSFVENTVAAFNAAVKATREAAHADAKACHYAKMLGLTLAEHGAAQPLGTEGASVDTLRKAMQEAYEELKDRAWTAILRSTDVLARTSSKVRRQIEAEFANVKALEFTVENIYGFLHGLVSCSADIQRDMALEVFDLITRYHSDNVVFYKGWASNDKHRSAGMRVKHTRFILPGFSTEPWQSSMGHNCLHLLRDIDKVFAMLEGKPEPEDGLYALFSSQFKSLRTGARLSSTYFDVRYYPGVGTIHFFPRSQALMDKLNRFVGRARQWLPASEGMASEAYWEHYQKAERFDKAVREEVLRGPKRGWRSALDEATSADAETRQGALSAVDVAISTVLERHGIQVDQLLSAPKGAALLKAA